jgi:four helix bundle protein
MGDFRKLLAWQRARVLAGAVYRVTEDFPAREHFGLADQMRRAAISVVSNIAEGANRGSDRELRRYLCIARGSLGELEAQITIAADLKLIPEAHAAILEQSALETGRLITGLVRHYSQQAPPPPATRDPRAATISKQTTAPAPTPPPTST